MKQISMYFKSDFTVILASEAQWGGCPFRIKLWTASPAEGRSIKACFDGEVWHNCRLLDDGRLQISVNQGDLGERQYMGIGTLKMDIEFYLSNADFNDHICNEHIKTFEPVFQDKTGEQYKLYLDNQGASTITTYGTLPAFYMKGEIGVGVESVTPYYKYSEEMPSIPEDHKTVTMNLADESIYQPDGKPTQDEKGVGTGAFEGLTFQVTTNGSFLYHNGGLRNMGAGARSLTIDTISDGNVTITGSDVDQIEIITGYIVSKSSQVLVVKPSFDKQVKLLVPRMIDAMNLCIFSIKRTVVDNIFTALLNEGWTLSVGDVPNSNLWVTWVTLYANASYTITRPTCVPRGDVGPTGPQGPKGEDADIAAAEAATTAALEAAQATVQAIKDANQATANANYAGQEAYNKGTEAQKQADSAKYYSQQAAIGATVANAAATNANNKAALAEEKAGEANDAATIATEKAQLADNAAQNADEKAGLAQTAASAANTATTNANTAATKAANVNAVLNGDNITVTDQNGNSVTRNIRGPKGDSVTMFPAVTIFGQPRIQETQMSEFSAANYAQFPFLVDFAGRHWQLDCAITTGSDVSQQHNVFDSAFGLAFAFSGGKFVLAMSSNGTSWNLGATSGTHSILANITYYIRITWDGTTYILAYSTDKVNWTNDITVTSTESLASKQIIIGKSLDNAHIFNGSINFAEARLTIAGVIVWEGMEEVGTATRMAIDMSNIDEAGKQKVNDIVGEGAVGQAIADLNARQGAYPAFPDIPLSLAVSGKVIGTDGQLVTKAGYGISAPVEVQKGNTYRFPSSEAIGGHALFAQVLTREVQYTITMQSYTEGTETRERIERISTTRGIGGIGRVYRCVYSGENDTIVGIWQDSAEDGYSWLNVPVVGWKNAILNPKMLDGTPMTSELLYADITSAAGGQVAIRPSYTEYSPKFNANGVVSLTANGEYVLLSSFEGLMVVSGKLADLSEGKVLHQSRDGKDASMANQLAAKADVDMLAWLYKKGVVSQTQTWYGEDGRLSTQTNDYHHYVMSNIQWGIIPQANIDLFLSAGAEFNDTDSPIEKTAPWGEKVMHLPGYFYLNGLGDISYNEMEAIWKQPVATSDTDLSSLLMSCEGRTNFKLTKTWGTNIGVYTSKNIRLAAVAANNRKIEVLDIGLDNLYNKLAADMTNFIWNANSLRYVLGYIPCTDPTSSITIGTYSLKNMKLAKISANINLATPRHFDVESILFMIQNATNGSKDITITLHKNAYDRAVADAEIQAALAANGHIQLLSA